MRILQVAQIYYPELKGGGPPEKIHALSRGLAARGHSVRVVTFHSERPKDGKCVTLDGIPVQYIPWIGRNERQIPVNLRLLTEAMRETDIVHGYGLYNLLCPRAVSVARRARRPFVLEPLGMYTPKGGNRLVKKLYHCLFTKYMFRHAAAVIATSPAEARELSGVLNEKKIVLRRNGIDTTLFQNLLPAKNFRARFKIGDSEKIILFMGRIDPIKNLVELMHAFVEAAVPNCRLALVGPILEPDYAAEVQATIHSTGAGEKVLLTGALYGEEKLEAYSAADSFVLPSLSESFGNAAAEAIAAGLPVLVTEGCGIAPMIRERAGLVVPCTRAGLRDGLRALMNDSQRAVVTRRRAEVVAELSWEEPLRQTEELYRQIATGPERKLFAGHKPSTVGGIQ